MKLRDLLKEVYPYRKGPSMVKNRMYDTTMDIDRMYKGARSYDEFEPRFRRKYKNYPNTPEAGDELRNLWTMYHDQELNEVEFLNKLKDLGKRAIKATVKAITPEGGDPVKASDLKVNNVYKIWHDSRSTNIYTGKNVSTGKKFESAWIADAVYIGEKDGKHQFKLTYVYDKEPMTGNAPKRDHVVEFAPNEVEKTVVTAKDDK